VSLLAGERLTVLDTETTGVSPAYGATVVEVARVEIESGEVGASWSSLVHPGRQIPAGATAVHGITDSMVAAAPTPTEAATAFRAALEGRTLVFHNASFDLPFLVAMLRQAGLPRIFNPVVDTLGLARGLFGDGSNSLSELSARLGLRPERFHRALVDAHTTAAVFLALASRWETERGVHTLAELAGASQDAIRTGARR
jgi:DNA polymerase III epsilon subunit family exonuclease